MIEVRGMVREHQLGGPAHGLRHEEGESRGCGPHQGIVGGGVGMGVIDDYIAGSPKEVQGALKKLRQAVRKAAPGAEEKISYGLPCFALAGNLVYFGAWKTHIGFYPGSARAQEVFKREFAPFDPSKGTLRFPLDRPLPLDLVARVVRFRIQENLEKAAKSGQRAKPKSKPKAAAKPKRITGKVSKKASRKASGKTSEKTSKKA
jgi:uncharacterized protein YdhG (YjbR/CyaY superfamily)